MMSCVKGRWSMLRSSVSSLMSRHTSVPATANLRICEMLEIRKPEETRAKAKSGGLLKEAFGAILSQFGIDAELPQKSVKRDAAKIEEDEAVSTLNRRKAEAYTPYQGTLADVEVGKQVSGAVRDWQGNDRAIELGPLSGQAEAAGLAAKRDEARNYVGQFEQRKLENEIGLLQAQMRQQYLNNLQKILCS
jgi:hypothetical protein